MENINSVALIRLLCFRILFFTLNLEALSPVAQDYLIYNYWRVYTGLPKPVSVRAWINATVSGGVITAGEHLADWPLYIVEEQS